MRRPLPNLFELLPVAAVRSTAGDDGLVTLLVPKFRNRLLVRFLVPRLKQPDLRLHLDQIGSFVWQQCDGSTSVAELGRRAHERFGGERDAMDHRVAEFIAQLDRTRCLRLRPAAPPGAGPTARTSC